MPAFEDLSFANARKLDVVRIDKRRLAARDMDAVAGELVLDDLPLGLADVEDHEPQVVHGDVAFATVALVVDIAVPVPRQMQNGFANSLRRDCACVERDASQQLLLPFND